MVSDKLVVKRKSALRKEKKTQKDEKSKTEKKREKIKSWKRKAKSKFIYEQTEIRLVFLFELILFGLRFAQVCKNKRENKRNENERSVNQKRRGEKEHWIDDGQFNSVQNIHFKFFVRFCFLSFSFVNRRRRRRLFLLFHFVHVWIGIK